jgi:hypothetical protein
VRPGKAKGTGEDDEWALQDFGFNGLSPSTNFKFQKGAPASKIYEKKPEVMEEMKRNNFPFGINSKIETDFELRSQEETRF